MKSQKILLAAALLALGAASCQKEENVITQFTAGMEQSEAKTYLDGQLLKWVSGDQVKVYSDGANGADFDVTPRDGNATWAVLSNNNGGITESGQYTAIYPASIAASATSVTLPAVQNSADGSLAEFPMYAESTTDEFQFKNLCGALRIHLAAANCTNCTISRIKVTAGSAINGTYTVSTTTEGDPLLGTCTDGSTTTTLILGTAQPIAEGRDFYVYLPAGEYSNMQLTFYQPDGSYCTKSGDVTVERSVCSPVEITNSLTFSFPEDCIHGLFSVSATKQVYFSNGNLQYFSGTWRFAANQYDYFGTYYENAWDHFGWSTAATTYGMSTLQSGSGYSGDFVDWGTAINPNGGDAPWRTLTQAEWAYLLGTNNQRSGKWGYATITGVTLPGASEPSSVNGLVILPDSWSYNSINAGSTVSGYSANEYPAAEWAQMEAAGAVFLPAAGHRYGAGMAASAGMYGFYWSSTPNGGNYAYYMSFYYYYVDDFSNSGRYFGHSVRLVQDY